MSENQPAGSRRDFLAAGAAAASLAAVRIAGAHAQGTETIKIALIGCGGRGSGAAENSMDADPRVKLVAMADAFKDRLDGSLSALKGKFGDRVQVSEENKFLGFDAFEKAVKTEADYVILATPPHFRPAHFAAAVAARKNIFTEKPVAVDPAGIRKFMAAAEESRKAGLAVSCGLQRHHQTGYVEQAKRIRDGAIGKITAMRAYWCQGQLWSKSEENRNQDKWSDFEWMLRDWVNWCWLSGDHIVEQHVHNIDICNWMMTESLGKEVNDEPSHPLKAIGYGGHCHRPTGDQYDHFSVDFEYPGGVHLASYCRQINGTPSNVSEHLIGEKGEAHGGSSITGPNAWRLGRRDNLPYVQEHKDLIAGMTGKGPKLNEARSVATSTMTAIMGRIAAYTGKEVQWDEALNMDLRLGPTEYNDSVKLFPTKRPVAGRA